MVYLEPNIPYYDYYCGPGASQVMISNWTNNVPSLDTLGAQELTNQGHTGTYLTDMVGPINSDANTHSFYIVGEASSQAAFNNWVAGDLYYSGRPAITALMTWANFHGNGIFLDGFGYSGLNVTHIINIHGFNFSNPPSQGDNFYYVETTSKDGGTDQQGKQTVGANKMWAFVYYNDAQLF